MKIIKKVGIILGCFVLLIAMFIGVVNLFPVSKVETTPFTKTTRTLISAHRGGGNLNPENTKMAFDYVVKETSYVDIVEFDIRLTKDNVPVIIHDDYVNKLALNEDDELVGLKDHTYQELQNYNLGYNFIDENGSTPYKNISMDEAKNMGLTLMTLEEFLKEYKEVRDFKIFLEIKDKGENAITLADIALDLLASNDYNWWKTRTMIISSDDDAIDHIANVDPTQYIGAVGFKIAGGIIGDIFSIEPLMKPNYHCLQTTLSNKLGPIKVNAAKKSFVKSIHKYNQSIAFWGVETKEQMEHLIEIGADVITVDSPDVLAEVLNVL